MGTTTKKTFSVTINASLYNHFLRRSHRENRSMDSFVEMALFELREHQEPNEETKRVIEQADKDYKAGKMKLYSSVETLMADLEAD